MIRKLVVTLAIIGVLSTGTATGARAVHGGMGMHGGHSGHMGMHGGHMGMGMRAGHVGAMHRGFVRHNFAFHRHHFFHNRFAFRHHHRFFHDRFAFVGAGFAFDDECFVIRRVWTPWGWHWRRIWVCD